MGLLNAFAGIDGITYIIESKGTYGITSIILAFNMGKGGITLNKTVELKLLRI